MMLLVDDEFDADEVADIRVTGAITIITTRKKTDKGARRKLTIRRDFFLFLLLGTIS